MFLNLLEGRAEIFKNLQGVYAIKKAGKHKHTKYICMQILIFVFSVSFVYIYIYIADISNLYQT